MRISFFSKIARSVYTRLEEVHTASVGILVFVLFATRETTRDYIKWSVDRLHSTRTRTIKYHLVVS